MEHGRIALRMLVPLYQGHKIKINLRKFLTEISIQFEFRLKIQIKPEKERDRERERQGESNTNEIANARVHRN